MSATSAGGAGALEPENDLASIAAEAALELDLLALRRPTGVSATQRLVVLIGNTVADVPEPWSPSSLLNPATAVALGKALDEALYPDEPRMKRLPDLIKASAQLKDRLTAIAADPEHTSTAEKEELRGVCVAISRQAMAVENLAPYPYEHPFRNHT